MFTSEDNVDSIQSSIPLSDIHDSECLDEEDHTLHISPILGLQKLQKK
jgi:hypothetical protein